MLTSKSEQFPGDLELHSRQRFCRMQVKNFNERL